MRTGARPDRESGREAMAWVSLLVPAGTRDKTAHDSCCRQSRRKRIFERPSPSGGVPSAYTWTCNERQGCGAGWDSGRLANDGLPIDGAAGTPLGRGAGRDAWLLHGRILSAGCVAYGDIRPARGCGAHAFAAPSDTRPSERWTRGSRLPIRAQVIRHRLSCSASGRLGMGAVNSEITFLRPDQRTVSGSRTRMRWSRGRTSGSVDSGKYG